MDKTPPSKHWYRVSWVLVLVGFVAAAAWWSYSTTRVYDAVEEFVRTAPFGGPVVLAERGTHTFWIEGECLSCHDNEPAEYREAATVSVTGPDGERLRLRPAPARVFNTARREGRSLWLFDVRAPGPHRIALDFDTSGDWDNRLPGNIAVSRGSGLPISIVRPMFLFAGGGIGLGAAIAGFVGVRRRRHFARSA
jgi:hypothetical protein